MNAAMGVMYPLWLRTRWIGGGMLAYIAGIAIAMQLPALQDAREHIAGSSIGLFFLLATLLNALIFSPADLAAKGSAFPTHMWVLPLRTRSLVGWPMVFGGVLNGLLWALLVGQVFIPAQVPLPLVLPAAILMAVTTWIQAIAWSPFPSPLVRVPALLAVVLPAIALGGCAAVHS